MSRNRIVFFAVILACMAGLASAQSLEPAGQEGQAHASYGLVRAIFSTGPFGMLMWLGIVFWSLAAWPLGILSIVHSAMLRRLQTPLATKLLACGMASLLLLGGFGVAQGMMFALHNLATMPAGAAQFAMLALNLSTAVWAAVFSLGACLHYIFFISVSVIIIHFKHRKMLAKA